VGLFRAFAGLQSVPNWEELRRFTTIALRAIEAELNGRVEFGVNIYGKFVEYDFAVANVEYAVTHGLSSTPKGFIVCGLNVTSVIIDGATRNNATAIYLQASAVCSAKIFVF